jgi:virginiamycin B lyase
MKYIRIPAMVLVFIFVASFAMSAGKVSIEEWAVPTPDSFPHDPAVAPDGSLWYTGMNSNTLGVLDPKTGKIKEYRLKTPGSGPHGLAADADGNIWFTANYKGYIGKLDPRTGEVTEFPIPDPEAGDPHTPVFDQKGTLWFTVQAGGFVGRLDPRSGSITLKRPPTQGARPYGIAVNSKGVPFFCEFGTNKIARIDPATLEITEYTLPKGARPRRLVISSDDIIYYTDYARGYLGRLDPGTGKVEERASPGGPRSGPYGMALTPDGAVWYSETNLKPNMIVRFDPLTGKFSSWPVPSGGKVIRNMAATPKGDIYFASSGANKVGIIKVEK